MENKLIMVDLVEDAKLKGTRITETNMDNNFLQISREDFQKGYDYDFTPYIQSDYTGITYLPWSNAYLILRELFPNLDVAFDPMEGIENQLDKSREEAIEPILRAFDEIIAGSDKRAQKKAQNAKNRLQNELIHKGSGFYVKPYLYDTATGARTPAHSFPVMDSTNNYLPNPNARELSDANMRGAVKAIALYTGIGLRLWTRENMDIRKNDNSHPVFKGLQAIYEQKMECLSEFGILPDKWQDPDFGWSVFKLRELSASLADYLENGGDGEEEAKVWDGWKTPNIAVKWAMEQLDISKKDATAIFNEMLETIEDKSSFKEPFYNKVISMSKD